MPDDVARLLALQDGYVIGRGVHLAAELGLADLMANGPRAVTDLATATNTDPTALHRLLRTLAGSGIFTQPTPGCFALTPMGHHLRSDDPHSVRSYLRWGEFLATTFDAIEHSVRTGRAAFDHVHGASLFEFLRADPDRATMFRTAMGELSTVEDEAVATAYDFTTARTVVDIGGGSGTFLCTILYANPTTTGVLFDQPAVAEAARTTIDTAGLADRCTATAGDFFHRIVPGGDVYLLKSVIHDWPDDQATTILTNCRAAMREDARLLLVERVVPEDDDPHPSKPMDLAMLILLGGGERTSNEYETLLAGAGFRVTRTVRTASASSIIEAVPA